MVADRMSIGEEQVREYVRDCLEKGYKIRRRLIYKAVTFSHKEIECMIRDEKRKNSTCERAKGGTK